MLRLVCAALVAAAIAGCGTTGGAASGDRASLLLDERPSAVDVGIYLAIDRGYDQADGVSLDLASDPGRAGERVAAGRADVAVLDARALARRPGLVGVMQITQRPVHGRLYLVAVSRTTLEDRRADVRGIVAALQRGYVEAQTDPDSAVSAMLDREDNLDRTRLAADLDTIAPAFTEGAPAVGVIDRAAVRRAAGGPVALDTSLVGPVSRD